MWEVTSLKQGHSEWFTAWPIISVTLQWGQHHSELYAIIHFVSIHPLSKNVQVCKPSLFFAANPRLTHRGAFGQQLQWGQGIGHRPQAQCSRQLPYAQQAWMMRKRLRASAIGIAIAAAYLLQPFQNYEMTFNLHCQYRQLSRFG